jgi:hypothetical protein
VLLEGPTGLFPVESVLFAIEVKSALSYGVLKSAHEKALKLANLRYLSGYRNQQMEFVPHPVMNLVPALFAFRSDLKKGSEIERYSRVVGEGGHPAFGVLCVVGRGIWSMDPALRWVEHKRSGEYDEIVHFIGLLMASYPHIAQTRGFPAPGEYLFA